MERKVYKFENKRIEKFNYLIHLPKLSDNEKLPLIVMLHGAGERGDHDDLLAQKGRYYELYTGLKELD